MTRCTTVSLTRTRRTRTVRLSLSGRFARSMVFGRPISAEAIWGTDSTRMRVIRRTRLQSCLEVVYEIDGVSGENGPLPLSSAATQIHLSALLSFTRSFRTRTRKQNSEGLRIQSILARKHLGLGLPSRHG